MDSNKTFNKTEFAQLLEKAKGDRSINQYANETGVSAAHISRFLRELIEAPPTPETISKLVLKANNGVTYRDMMIAAGYLLEQTNNNNEPNIDHIRPASLINDSPMNLRNEMELLEKKFMQIILGDLYKKSYMWSPAQFDTKTISPDMLLNIDQDEYKRWFIDFRPTPNGRNFMSQMNIFNILGRISTVELYPTDKYTIAVNNEKAYHYFFRRPPISLRVNLYVMLIDIDKGEVIKEEMLCEYK